MQSMYGCRFIDLNHSKSMKRVLDNNLRICYHNQVALSGTFFEN